MIYQARHAFLTLMLLFFFSACNNKKASDQKKIEPVPITAEAGIDTYIKNILAESQAADSTKNNSLPFNNVMVHYYDSAGFKPIWSAEAKWNVFADSLISYLDTAYREGLFKSDYHFLKIDSLVKTLKTDSLKMKEKKYWAEADVLMTNAFFNILQDLKQGRLQHDSLTLKNNIPQHRAFFASFLDTLILERNFSEIIRSVQPLHPGYIRLKNEIRHFVDTMDKREYTYLTYPYKKGNKVDSILFTEKLQLRLNESGFLDLSGGSPDSVQLANAVKRYQSSVKIQPDGKVTSGLIKSLNNTDIEKFRRIVITLDRFKQLPAKMPEKFIWVNLPSYRLQVFDTDTVVMESKIICGKPNTPTPIITSEISDLVIYPTWTVPESIIAKELLPGLKKNTGYLAKKGLNLLNNKGEIIDPATVNWEKFTKAIPYRVQQGSGDNNALGVIKFNFSNPYAVYLHDTNQRYLFKNSSRALSHGCVRVQEWQKLAHYIIKNDSIRLNRPDTIKYTDSINSWISNKERHRITIRHQFPLFIRYFGCEAINGSIKFHEDIYGSDKILRDRFFSQKKI